MIVIAEGKGATAVWYDGTPKRTFELALHASRAIERYEGGIDQIEFDDEDRGLRELFEKECAKNGVTVNMLTITHAL